MIEREKKARYEPATSCSRGMVLSRVLQPLQVKQDVARRVWSNQYLSGFIKFSGEPAPGPHVEEPDVEVEVEAELLQPHLDVVGLRVEEGHERLRLVHLKQEKIWDKLRKHLFLKMFVNRYPGNSSLTTCPLFL